MAPRSKIYKAAFKKVAEEWKKDRGHVSRTVINIPKYISDEIRVRRRGKSKSSFSITDACVTALRFGLFGPHDYRNPVDAIDDAFARYFDDDPENECEMVRRIIVNIADLYNINVYFDDPKEEQ